MPNHVEPIDWPRNLRYISSYHRLNSLIEIYVIVRETDWFVMFTSGIIHSVLFKFMQKKTWMTEYMKII